MRFELIPVWAAVTFPCVSLGWVLGVELPGRRVNAYLSFLETATQFSKEDTVHLFAQGPMA